MKIVAAALAVLAFASHAHAAERDRWPVRPVRIVLGFAPGSVIDVMTRFVTPKLSEALGQPVLVDNKPGAGSNLGTGEVARATPDGYTLLMGGVANAINASLYKNLQFDFVRDFAPVSPLANVPNLLVVHPSVPVRTVEELIALAKSKPGELLYGSSGSGTGPHLAGELFNLMAGIKLVHVPYKSSPQAMTDLLAGRVQVIFTPPSTALPYMKSGQLRVLASTGAHRPSAVPDVPTVMESGLPKYDTGVWMGLFAPVATPRDIVERLNRDVQKALATPELKAQFAAQGMDPMIATTEEFTAYVKGEMEKWNEAVRASGARVD